MLVQPCQKALFCVYFMKSMPTANTVNEHLLQTAKSSVNLLRRRMAAK